MGRFRASFARKAVYYYFFRYINTRKREGRAGVLSWGPGGEAGGGTAERCPETGVQS